MKVIELVAAAKTANPKAFANIEDAQAMRITAAVLEQVGTLIEATREGSVAFTKLGRFSVKNMPQLKGPEPVKRRVFFVRAKAAAVAAKL